MATFRIEFSDDEARRIEKLAREQGLTPEEYVRRGVQEWLKRPQVDFAEAASYVLKKNSDLYRRLS